MDGCALLIFSLGHTMFLYCLRPKFSLKHTGVLDLPGTPPKLFAVHVNEYYTVVVHRPPTESGDVCHDIAVSQCQQLNQSGLGAILDAHGPFAEEKKRYASVKTEVRLQRR